MKIIFVGVRELCGNPLAIVMSISQPQSATWIDLPWAMMPSKQTHVDTSLDNLTPSINVTTPRADALIRAIQDNPDLATATEPVTDAAVIGKRVIDELLALVDTQFWAPDDIIYLPNNYRSFANENFKVGSVFHQDVNGKEAHKDDAVRQIFVAVGTNGVPPIMTEFRKHGTQIVHAPRSMSPLQSRIGSGGLFRLDFVNGQTIRYTGTYRRHQTEAIPSIPRTVADPQRAVVADIRYASYSLWESPNVTAQRELDRVATSLLDFSEWNGKAYGFEIDFDDELVLETTASRAQDAVAVIAKLTYDKTGNPFGTGAANRLVFASLALQRSVKDPDLQAQAVSTWTDTTRAQLVSAIQETLASIRNVPHMPTIGWDTLKTAIRRMQSSTVMTKQTVAAEIASRQTFPLNQYIQTALDTYIKDHTFKPNMIPVLTRAVVEFNLVRDPTFAYPNMAEFFTNPPTAAVLATDTNTAYENKPGDMFRRFVHAIEPHLIHGFYTKQQPTTDKFVVDVNAQFADLVKPPQDSRHRTQKNKFVDLSAPLL